MNAQAQILNCDVVVVGGGGSGLAAAIEAAVSGASVVVLEKEASLRGSTGRSVGAIAASRTPDQRQLGVDDTPELHLADYRKLSGDRAASENEDLARLLVNNVTETLAWLRGLGVEFFGPVEGAGHSAPRLHNALPGSQAYIYHLRKRARRLGVRVLLNTAVERINHIDGSVTGVEARTRDGREVRARARRAVVLTTGDFSASAEMKRTYLGDRYAGFLPVNPAATGDAQRMAAQMGGEVINGDLIDLPTLRLAPPGRGRLVRSTAEDPARSGTDQADQVGTEERSRQVGSPGDAQLCHDILVAARNPFRSWRNPHRPTGRMEKA
ncbi:MAG: FAD-dependent oxidoreductase [Hyphomicrobiales bacterium]|nr:MAG: FAD-dependent oxidoreductase [Hyphomicrobiales bacterium]